MTDQNDTQFNRSEYLDHANPGGCGKVPAGQDQFSFSGGTKWAGEVIPVEDALDNGALITLTVEDATSLTSTEFDGDIDIWQLAVRFRRFALTLGYSEFTVDQILDPIVEEFALCPPANTLD